ncbi:Ankyrin-2 (ANK-2) (Ankyrin-B) (Brain ankyrin) (Non-erythroid ankyrin) [Durusdinium trenchii]|uniref:Ankyrin-2 (ANK-2) (Ankyrin-B) (Brain ankyrin) (Non-erythroid ankyrin) n=1 Tax=Durusdinium trenchii TaxID=1381693 RepID=A0ABP0I214_9DINO
MKNMEHFNAIAPTKPNLPFIGPPCLRDWSLSQMLALLALAGVGAAEDLWDDAEVFQEVATPGRRLGPIPRSTDRRCDLLRFDGKWLAAKTKAREALNGLQQPVLIVPSSHGEWRMFSQLLEEHGEEVHRVNNGRVNGAGKVHGQLPLKHYLQHNSSDFHIFTVNRPDTGNSGNGSTGLIDEVRWRVKQMWPWTQLATDLAARWIFSLGLKASHVDRHSHEESWLLLLEGRKAWWIGAEPGNNPEYIAWEDPCAALGRATPPGIQFCVVYVGTHLEHSTCNLDHRVWGVGAQGSRSEWPLLVQAAQEGELSALQELLDARAEPVQATTERGQSALHLAASFGREAVLEKLLAKGARLEQKDHGGGAALHSAAEGGHSRVIRQLLRARAQFQLDASGRQPLHLAATAGHVAAAQQLLEADADPTVASARQEQPLHLATSSCRLTHLLLAFRAAVSAEDHEGVQAIHWAAASGSHCVVRALLASKASLASGDRVHGGQPIHWAAANGRVKMVNC